MEFLLQELRPRRPRSAAAHCRGQQREARDAASPEIDADAVDAVDGDLEKFEGFELFGSFEKNFEMEKFEKFEKFEKGFEMNLEKREEDFTKDLEIRSMSLENTLCESRSASPTESSMRSELSEKNFSEELPSEKNERRADWEDEGPSVQAWRQERPGWGWSATDDPGSPRRPGTRQGRRAKDEESDAIGWADFVNRWDGSDSEEEQLFTMVACQGLDLEDPEPELEVQGFAPRDLWVVFECEEEHENDSKATKEVPSVIDCDLDEIEDVAAPAPGQSAPGEGEVRVAQATRPLFRACAAGTPANWRSLRLRSEAAMARSPEEVAARMLQAAWRSFMSRKERPSSGRRRGKERRALKPRPPAGKATGPRRRSDQASEGDDQPQAQRPHSSKSTSERPPRARDRRRPSVSELLQMQVPTRSTGGLPRLGLTGRSERRVVPASCAARAESPGRRRVTLASPRRSWG